MCDIRSGCSLALRAFTFPMIALLLLSQDAPPLVATEVPKGTVSLKDKEYVLTYSVDEVKNWSLSWSSGRANRHGQVAVSGIDVPNGAELKEVNLAVWNDVSVFAVVVYSAKGRYVAQVVMFPLDVANRSTVAVRPRTIASGNSRVEVLAINGKFQGDGIVVVLGELRAIRGQRVVHSCAVLLDDCPMPDEVAGTISEFSDGLSEIPRLPGEANP